MGSSEGESVTTEVNCPECHGVRKDPSIVCPTCGAPPVSAGDKRELEEEVRSNDLEPYVTLRYIARLFKVLAVMMVILLAGEIFVTVTTEAFSLADLIGRVTQLLVLAGLMWGGGDLTLLGIDAGHDLRVARILLGRINAELHRRGAQDDKKG
jgi:hypothetical protein